jgi:hypothetical protein
MVADPAAPRRRLAHMSTHFAAPLDPAPLTDDSTAAKAIEVATMLGDSVVDVKHCMDPQSGKVTPRTWGLAAAGLSCVLLSAAAFAASVSTAADNAAALEHWTQVAKKPARAFRPHTLGLGYDWLAVGGFVLGVGALAGALGRMRRERQSPYYRIGTAPGVEQPLEGAPSESFPLVAPRGDDFVFNFGAGVHGELLVDGRTQQLAELAANGRAQPSATVPGAFELPIPMHARIRAQVGQTSFMVAGVPRPREHAAPLFAGLESRTMGYFAGSLAAHLGLVLLLAQIPVDGGSATIDLAMAETVDMHPVGTVSETTPPEIPEDTGEGGTEGAAAASMHLDPGAAGTPESTNQSGQLQIKDNGMPPQLAAERARVVEEARSAGILGAPLLRDGALFTDLYSSETLSSGFSTTDQWGPLYGAAGEGHGSFGYGRTGFGAGCDINCTGGGIVGMGGYSHIGLGKFGREGYTGPGGGRPGMPGRTAKTPGPRIGEATGGPGFDKSIVRRYIKRNISKIAYCYEKELLARPGIEGSVMIQFFISPSGSVSSSVGKGFDTTVANCVADVVGAIDFPRMGDGGGVQVNYPFTFTAAGR